MQSPLVSIVMPVYNAEAHVVAAVASLVEQSFAAWELICVNDGSTDGSGRLLDRLASLDSRIRVLHQSNAGIVAALNAGCAAARTPVLCRMDSDDLALPERLRRQWQFLEEHPQCVAVGGGILEIDADGDPLSECRLPCEHSEIVDNLLHRKTGLFHPTVMMRASAFQEAGGYRAEYQWVEDHDLWLRLAQVGKLANLSQLVLCYRQHAGSVCWQRSQQQRALMNKLLVEAYSVRSRKLPHTLLASDTRRRTAAGPGKWARAAAKGGYPRSAHKHLRALLRSSAGLGYKSRLTLEVTLRLLVGLLKVTGRRSVARVPSFPTWEERVQACSPEARLPASRRAA